MIDTETRQPVDIFSIHDGLIKEYIETEKPCPIAASSRVKMGKDAELVRTIHTYYNDVDVNGHINSVKYIEHVLIFLTWIITRLILYSASKSHT